MESKVCCFIGHRNVEKTDELVLATRRVVLLLVEEENVRAFAFGSRSKFDNMCYDIVCDIQKQYPIIKKVCLTCKSECCILNSEKEEWKKVYRTFDEEITH